VTSDDDVCIVVCRTLLGCDGRLLHVERLLASSTHRQPLQATDS